MARREAVRNLRFPMSGNVVSFECDVEGFVEDFVAGNLQPTIKSEPLPEKSSTQLVDVVGLNYRDIVLDHQKHVLLEFYTDWCAPCERLLLTLEELAELYASDGKLEAQVTIAAEANDFPDRDVLGYPGMKLYPAAAKDAPVLYGGDFSSRDMAGFIRDYGTHEVDICLGDESAGKPVLS